MKRREAVSWDKGKLSEEGSVGRLVSLFGGFQGKMNNILEKEEI